MTFWRPSAWLLAAAFAAFHGWMLQQNVVNFPLQDDYSQLLTVPRDIDDLPTLGDRIGYLVSSSGDHRVATLRLAALFQAKVLGEINFRGLAFWGNLLCAVTGLLTLSAAKPTVRAWLAVLVAALLFSPSNWLPQYWASASLQHYSMLAFAFGAIYCASRPRTPWLVAGLFLGLLAAMTGASGMMVFPVGAVLLYRLDRRRTATLWLLVAAVIAALYFVDYRPPPGRLSPLNSLHHPLSLLVFSLTTLGSAGERFTFALAIGTALVVAWLWLAGTRRKDAPPVLAAWMAFLLLCVGTIAVGRESFGQDAMLISRYRVYSELAIVITIIARLWNINPRQGALLLAVMLPTAAIWFWSSWERNLASLAEMITQQRTSQTHYAVTGRGIYRGFPPQEATDNLLRRAHDDGYFGQGAPSKTTATFIDAGPLSAQTGSINLWTDAPIVDGAIVSVRGFVRVTDPRLQVWLEGNKHLFRGELKTQRLVDLAGPDWMLFWNSLSLRSIPPGLYRTGFSSGADGHPQIITWSGRWLEVK